MGDDITIGVTEIVNNIEVTAQPNDQIIDISVIDNADDVTLNITPTVIEVNVNKGSSYAKWGTILGTLSDQTDLQSALNLKANLVDGKVPASELPSYVDDVIEVADYAALPTTGEIGKIYVTLDNNKIYRWSGSIYIEIAANNSIWGAITGTLSNQLDLQAALDAKQNTLVSGTSIKTLEGQSLLGSGNIDLSKSDVGLGNVDNTSDANKPISTATQTALDLKANTSQLHDAVTIATANGLSLSTQALSLGLASSTLNGALSSTDWNTFNNKQNALSGTGFVKISGTTISYDNNTYALDSAVVKLTGTQTISGLKTFSGAIVANSQINLGLGSPIYFADSTNSKVAIISNTSSDGTTLGITSSLATFTGNINALSFIKSGGTSSQFLKADGTVDSSVYVPTSRTLTINGTAYDLSDNRSWTISGLPSMLEYNDTDKTVWNNGKGNFSSNTSFGDGAFKNNSSGTSSTSYGNNALRDNSTGNSNTALGVGSLISNSTGSNNVAIGQSAGQTYQNISTSIFIGNSTAATGENQSNVIVIGHNATGNGSNSVTLGNTSITKTILNGNVGIGTTSPVYKFHVNDTSDGIVGHFSGGVSNYTLISFKSNEANVYSTSLGSYNSGMLFRTGATDRMYITSGGNVGIGTTSPSYKLHNVGDTFSTNYFMNRGGGLWNIIPSGGANELYFKEETGGNVRMTILGSGNVGIGTPSPSYTLHVNGSVAGTSAYNNLSDKRYKKDILPIENALGKILALNGVTFNWDKEATDMNLDDNNHIGLLAQDVEEIIPQAVTTGTDENETKSVAYTDLVPVLIEAIKELKAEIDLLKQK